MSIRHATYWDSLIQPIIVLTIWWWRLDMGTLSVLLAFYERNPNSQVDLHIKRPAMWSFYIFFVVINNICSVYSRVCFGTPWRSCTVTIMFTSILHWRHNGHDSVSNYQPRHCILNRLVGTDKTKTIKAPRHWPLCGEFTGDRWIPHTNGQ